MANRVEKRFGLTDDRMTVLIIEFRRVSLAFSTIF
jgi:hypothetical protein